MRLIGPPTSCGVSSHDIQGRRGWLGRGIEENFPQFFPTFRLGTTVAGLALFLATALGMVAGLLPAYRTFRLNVVEALRRVA